MAEKKGIVSTWAKSSKPTEKEHDTQLVSTRKQEPKYEVAPSEIGEKIFLVRYKTRMFRGRTIYRIDKQEELTKEEIRTIIFELETTTKSETARQWYKDILNIILKKLE